jgi:hypothetical protein
MDTIYTVPRLLLIALLTCIGAGSLLVACDTSSVPDPVSAAPDGAVAHIQGKTATLLLDQPKLQRLVASNFDLEEATLSSAFRFSLDTEGPTRYLVGKTTDSEGNCMTVAFQLTRMPLSSSTSANLPGTYYSTGDTVHKCEGDPCESCGFVRDEQDAITGCDCVSWYGGTCNHTIATVQEEGI